MTLSQTVLDKAKISDTNFYLVFLPKVFLLKNLYVNDDNEKDSNNGKERFEISFKGTSPERIQNDGFAIKARCNLGRDHQENRMQKQFNAKAAIIGTP